MDAGHARDGRQTDGQTHTHTHIDADGEGKAYRRIDGWMDGWMDM